MRNIFSLIFILLAFTGYSQERKDITLNIYSGDCRPEPPHALYWQDTIWIYKHDSLVKKMIPGPYIGTRDPITVNHLIPGVYRLVFTNIYSQRADHLITIPDTSVFAFRICPDELTDQQVNTLAGLKIGESIRLGFKETSCGVDGDAELEITRKNGYFIAVLKDHENGYYNSLTVKLTPKMESDFTRFENELRFVNDNGRCTTQDYYTIKSKYGVYAKRDGTCEWAGFYFLKNSLMGPTE